MIYLSPGVYAREKDATNIVSGIATTSAGLVGYSEKGDVDNIKLITSISEFEAEYGKRKIGQYFHYSAIAYLKQGKTLYCLRVTNGALYGGVKIMKTGGTNAPLSSGVVNKTFQQISGEDICFFIFGVNPGLWNNGIGVKVININSSEYTFTIEVYVKDADGNDVKVESWDVSRKVKKDGYGKQMFLETKINGFSKYIWVADNPTYDNTVMPSEQATVMYMQGGDNGSAVTDSQIVAGWEKFRNENEVDVRILINGGYTSVNVQRKMIEIAEARKDCLAILDPEYTKLSSTTTLVDWRKNVLNANTSYASLYAGWIKDYDEDNDMMLELPPSGYIAGVYAYNDTVAEVVDAPAGLNRGLLNVAGVTNKWSQGDMDVLYPNQINPIPVFSGEGIPVWGQKTLQVKASVLDRVNVRRMLIVVEKSLTIALKPFCFERNNDVTRFRITAMCEEYLAMLGAKGYFQTEGGDKGYYVMCNEENNTPAVIQRNELHVDIFVKPAMVGEFIQLTTILTPTGVGFEEMIANGVYL